mmetsp:Transcript_20215/g.62856  ORF Transcript_20215/g.62856 Transcript_20215/m.62856 type:complete len:306 (-) Transcript_20215:594-1511(-)
MRGVRAVVLVGDLVHRTDYRERAAVEEAGGGVGDRRALHEAREAPIHLLAVKGVLVLARDRQARALVVFHGELKRTRWELVDEAALHVDRVEIDRDPLRLLPVLRAPPARPHENGPAVAVDGDGWRVDRFAREARKAVHVPHKCHISHQAVGKELAELHETGARLILRALRRERRALLGRERVEAERLQQQPVERAPVRQARVVVLHGAEDAAAQPRPAHELQQLVQVVRLERALSRAGARLIARACLRVCARAARARAVRGLLKPRDEGAKDFLLARHAKRLVLQHSLEALARDPLEGCVVDRG